MSADYDRLFHSPDAVIPADEETEQRPRDPGTSWQRARSRPAGQGAQRSDSATDAGRAAAHADSARASASAD